MADKKGKTKGGAKAQAKSGASLPSKSSSSSKSNSILLSLLAYVFSLIGFVFYFVADKNDRFTRFHSLQATAFGWGTIIVDIGLWIITLILGFIPAVGGALALIMGLISLLYFLGVFVYWLFLLYKVYKGEMYKIPFIGNFVEQWA